LVNQFTPTAILPTAVLASDGTTSLRTTQAIGARPILKKMTKPMTAVPDSTWLCVFKPMARRSAVRDVPSAEVMRSRLDPIDCGLAY
jgi:hypothetical protein